jgi:predicted metalloprotease with PDZ domain
MSIRHLIQCLIYILPAIWVHGSPLSAVHYTLNFEDAAHHYLTVQADLPTDGADELEVFLPVWTPGSYLIREYSRNIDRISATAADGTLLAIVKTEKNRWRIHSPGQKRVLLTYRLYGWEINVRSNWIEGDFAMINGAPTYITVAQNYQRPYTVTVNLPTDWAGVYTPLKPGATPHTYTASDYDTLVDSPLLAGSPQVDSFDLAGTPHYLVTIGGDGVWDNAKAARNFAQVAATQMKFWGELPSQEPYYVFNLLTGDRGGLEHKHSFVMTADRWLSRTRSGIGSWLSLVSHEYFHVWNGKRLRPFELGPFDYEHENYTPSLWVVEGITSYYQHIMLLRAGFSDPKAYLRTLSSQIRGVESIPGRLEQSLRDSSFDAWIKGYRPDENSANTRQSYYSSGSVAAALLDAEIRRLSNGTKSLDDLMHAAYAKYSGEHGYTEEEFITLASETAGADLAPWFAANVQSPGQYDYQPMLDWYGLKFADPAAPDQSLLPNKLEPADQPDGWLGLETQTRGGKLVVARVLTDTPAYAGGVYPEDELIALNGFRIEGRIEDLLRGSGPGEQVELLVSRRGRLVNLEITLGSKPVQSWQLEIRPDATAEQKSNLEAWLGQKEPSDKGDMTDDSKVPAAGS